MSLGLQGAYGTDALSQAIQQILAERKAEAAAKAAAAYKQQQDAIQNSFKNREVGVQENKLAKVEIPTSAANIEKTTAETAATTQGTEFKADDRLRLMQNLSMLPNTSASPGLPTPRLIAGLKVFGGPDLATPAGLSLFRSPTQAGQAAGQQEQAAFDSGGQAVDQGKATIEANKQIRINNAKPQNGEERPLVLNPNAPSGDDFLKTLSPTDQNMVKALAEGRQPWPSSFALKTPYWQDLMQKVYQYDPTFDTATASNNARQKVRTDFTSGKSAQQVNALNTVIGHLANLSSSSKSLANTSIPFVNKLMNWASTAIGNPEVKNFNTDREAVASELVRVWRQAGGAEADIQGWKAQLDAANSPRQFAGVASEIGHLLESKLGSLQDQYQQGMGRTKVNVISPESRSKLDALEGNAPPQVLAAGPGRHTFANGQVWDVSADGQHASQVK